MPISTPSAPGQPGSAPDSGGSQRFSSWSLWLIVALVLVAWLWVTVPLATGDRTLYYRDVTDNNLPVKAFGAEMLRQGKIPTFNPRWGLGQPFRGNPGSLAFYPGNLLYLILPFGSAFNLHYCLHWLLAGVAMAFLARRLGQSRPAALMAGLVYFGSGWMLTNLSFYNLITVAAWWPAVMACAIIGGRRGIALAGLCCGLALLGGGPILATLGLVPLLMVAIQAHGWRRGVLVVGMIGSLGLLIALPQVVATARVLAFSVRGASQAGLAEIMTFVFRPVRFLELLLPFPMGLPAHGPPFGIWNWNWMDKVPYYLTIYQGLVALWLAAVAARRKLGWAILALAGLLVAAFAHTFGEVFVRLLGGLFRYPEKFLFWFALAMPLLAGWGLERMLAAGRTAGWRRAARWSGGALASLGLLLLVGRAWSVAQLAALHPDNPLSARILSAQLLLSGTALLLGGALLGLAAFACGQTGRHKERFWAMDHIAAAVLACQALSLVLLAPIVLVDSSTRFKAGAHWPEGLLPGDQLLGGLSLPRWSGVFGYQADVHPWRPMHKEPAADLAPAVGTSQGLGYPLATNGEGLGSVLKYQLQNRLRHATWTEEVNWLRTLGIRMAVFGAPVEATPDLRLASAVTVGGDSFYRYWVRDPAPEVRWPQQVVSAANFNLAVLAVGKSPDPLATLAVPAAFGELSHDPRGSVTLLESEADRLVFEVESEGGIVGVRRAFHPLLRARVDQEELPLFYADVFLIGVHVPPGRHRVTVEAAGAGPEIAGGLLALVVAAGCLWVGLWVGRPRRAHASGEAGQVRRQGP